MMKYFSQITAFVSEFRRFVRTGGRICARMGAGCTTTSQAERTGGRSMTNLEPGDRSMGIGRKAAVSFFVGLAALIAVGLNASGQGLRRVAPIATVAPAGCNVDDLFLSCLASQGELCGGRPVHLGPSLNIRVTGALVFSVG